MNDTRGRLLETEFFLERMKETQSDRFAFKCYLTAFLGLARSVTWIMQKEFGKVPGFAEWYDKVQDKMMKDGDMKLLKEKRNFTIKESPVQLQAQIDVSIGAPAVNIAVTAHPPTVIIAKADGTVERRVEPEPTPSPAPPVTSRITAEGKAITQWRWFFDDLPNKDVITWCDEQVSKLNTLVAECESQFSP